MESNLEDRIKMPIGLKIAAGYFIFTGITSLIWPLLSLGPNYSNFESLSAAAKAGSYTRVITINLLFLVSGIGLFKRKSWARKLGLWILVISSFYGINEFAWGLAKGKPNLTVLAISTGFVGVWNAIWFYLIYKKSSKNVLVSDKKILTQEQKTDDKIIASYTQRIINFVADTIFCFVLRFFLGSILYAKGYQYALEGLNGYIFGISCVLIYYFLQEAFSGRTLGKLISGTEVINEDGSKINIGTALGRTLCRFIPFDALSFIPNSNNRIGWHDKIPKTRVISIR